MSTTTTAATTTRTYRVVGMTCGHCVSAVEHEVGAIDGVTRVTVDLATGDVVVASTRPIADDEMAAAMDEAGYELAS
jgi:copper chaperone